MEKKGRAVVAMSGGVDSSVAAALLREAGWEVIGITLLLWEEKQAVDDARQAADSLGLEHCVIELKERFRAKVVDYFVREYRAGRTPNPCIACNREIKFATMLQKARELEASHLATGHYARVEYCAAKRRHLLQKAVDPGKDQSYMLYRLTREQLSRCLFPLGELTKEQVRRKAEALGLQAAAKRESQEICFIPDNDYRAFLRRYGLETVPGPIKDTRGEVLGTHAGMAFYTVGQRRGLGLVSPRPLYVLEIRAADNTLVVGERSRLYRAGLELEEINLIALDALDRREEVTVKIRYRSPEVPARLLPPPTGAKTARVIFTEPQPAVTPGQAAVFYRGDLVLGGGIIKTAL